jgi:hypothetical protein
LPVGIILYCCRCSAPGAQVSCQGAELAVIKRDGFWGQGDALLGPAGPDDGYSLPLGELEFLLDSTRRTQQQQQQQQQQEQP